MSNFICDTCGEEVLPIDGIVSWTKENKTMSNFKLTHKNPVGQKIGCQPDNNRYRELYTLTLAHGYLDFVLYLLGNWENNFLLSGDAGLRKVMTQLNFHIHEKLLMLIEE